MHDTVAKLIIEAMQLLGDKIFDQQKRMAELENKVTLLENAHLNLAEEVAQKESA